MKKPSKTDFSVAKSHMLLDWKAGEWTCKCLHCSTVKDWNRQQDERKFSRRGSDYID